MAIVRTFGALQAVSPSTRLAVVSTNQNTVPYSYAYGEEYAAIYASQPSVRKCVDFLARNIAQLGLHVFRRIDDTDRVRLTDHDLARWLGNPNPYTTTYRLIEGMVGDLALYFNAYWLKLRIEDPTPRIGLVRIPPPEMRVEGGLLPSRFIWCKGTEEVTLAPTEVVYFNGYNPQDPLMGLSPIETLRRQLAEDVSAQESRADFWRRGARFGGIIERPAAAPRWTATQKDSFGEQWRAKYHGPQSVSGTPILEEGMQYKQLTGSTYREAEYTTARKLSGEEAASLWHIPLPLVGYLDHATFSNIKEQHKQLYSDCLGPWLEMAQAAIERQLLPESRDTVGIYTEFNIAEKLKGSFEEQANALQLMVKRAVMTANEGRARLNLPRITDDPTADQLAAQQGGPAGTSAFAPVDETHASATAIVRAHLTRHAARLAKVPADAKAEALNVGRCISELHADLSPLLGHHAALDAAVRVTDHTYTLLLEGREAFAADREVLHVA